MVTAYDFPTARLADEAGVEILLVGDSVGTVVLGYESTLPVTMEDILHHTRAVTRAQAARAGGRRHAVHVLPGERRAGGARTPAGLIQEGGADAVKLEGGERVAAAVRRIVEIGIPVMGHLGLTPQSVLAFGGYRVQARGEADQERLLARGAAARGERMLLARARRHPGAARRRGDARARRSRPSGSARARAATGRCW